MNLLFALLVVLLPSALLASSVKVLVPQVALRSSPGGMPIGSLRKGDSRQLIGRFAFWGFTGKGWLNLDYTDANFEHFTELGALDLKVLPVGDVKATTGAETTYIPPCSVLIATQRQGDYIVGLWQNTPVAVPLAMVAQEPRTVHFKIVAPGKELFLRTGSGDSAVVEAGTPLLLNEEDGSILYAGRLWTQFTFSPEPLTVDTDAILRSVNRLVNIFNSARLSSPVVERLGYYAKVLPVTQGDVETLPAGDRVAVKLKLRYRLFYRNGKPVKGRRTRLILRKSSYEFWRKIVETCFQHGVTAFVELDILRFNGGSFETQGFIASGYHTFASGELSDTEEFLDNAELNLSKDLWFFVEEVYERLEGKHSR